MPTAVQAWRLTSWGELFVVDFLVWKRIADEPASLMIGKTVPR